MTKSRFDNIYNLESPAAYASAMLDLRYRDPDCLEAAKKEIARAASRLNAKRRLKIIDLCSGYGANALGLKHGLFGPQAFKWMQDPQDLSLNASAKLFAATPEIIGMDVAEKALAFSRRYGLTNRTICADLETRRIEAEEAQAIADTDLIISVGSLSYISCITIDRMLSAIAPSRPLAAWFWPLAGADMTQVKATLSRHGFAIEHSTQPVWQRQYRNNAERTGFLNRYRDLGVAFHGTLMEEGLCCQKLCAVRYFGE